MANDCKYLSDKFPAICVNGNCPAHADGCPAMNYQEICKYYEEGRAITGDEMREALVKAENAVADLQEAGFCIPKMIISRELNDAIKKYGYINGKTIMQMGLNSKVDLYIRGVRVEVSGNG